MNDLERFEAELKRLAPAQPPTEFLARLRAAQPTRPPARAARPPAPPVWTGWLRWLAPAMGVALAAAVALIAWFPHPTAQRERPQVSVSPAADPRPAGKVDTVQVDQRLLGSFDTVALLPTGEPVRFRCQRWMDRVTVEDKGRGMVFEERTPRLEVVPVRFETY